MLYHDSCLFISNVYATYALVNFLQMILEYKNILIFIRCRASLAHSVFEIMFAVRQVTSELVRQI